MSSLTRKSTAEAVQHELDFATTNVSGYNQVRVVRCSCGHTETVELEHGWSTTIQELDALDRVTIRNHASDSK